jgi:hypothetical protein
MCCARLCLQVNAGELVTLLHSRHHSNADVWGVLYIYIIWIGVQFRTFTPWKHCSQCGLCQRLIVISPFSKRSYSGRQVPLEFTTRGSPLAARGGTMGEKWWPDGAWDMHPGFFYMPQICDMGPIILLPFRRKACWGFLSTFKNPTASAEFEPANLGIRGQHATSAPPKPLMGSYVTAPRILNLSTRYR